MWFSCSHLNLIPSADYFFSRFLEMYFSDKKTPTRRGSIVTVKFTRKCTYLGVTTAILILT